MKTLTRKKQNPSQLVLDLACLTQFILATTLLQCCVNRLLPYPSRLTLALVALSAKPSSFCVQGPAKRQSAQLLPHHFLSVSSQNAELLVKCFQL